MRKYLTYLTGLFVLCLCLFADHSYVFAAGEGQTSDLKQPTLTIVNDIEPSELFTQKLSTSYNSEWETYSTYYYYNQLTDQEKVFYDNLNTMCLYYLEGTADASNGRTQYVDANGLSFDDIFDVVGIFYYSNPQYYFIGYNVVAGSSSSGGTTSTFAAVSINSSFQSGTDRQTATAAFKARLDEWEALIANESTDLLKEKKAHDLIINATTYNLSAKNDQSAYGILVDNDMQMHLLYYVMEQESIRSQ